MAITLCTITASLHDLVDAAVAASLEAKLYVKAPRGFMHGSTAIGPFEKSIAFTSGSASLPVIETETPGEKLTFYITYKEGKATRVINFLPAIVPNTATKNLSEITQVRPDVY